MSPRDIRAAFNENRTYRSSVFYVTISEAFLHFAFEVEPEADPNACLFYNDYSLEDRGAKAKAVPGIVKLIQSYSVKINVIGP
ncbi:glycoside hydrolase family 10 protein [Dothistroma septosporum NZE10]|uniref:Glycoside hydrolase family 10 protein n=1 Tax=Dothistroma septosporum (strain NZE10 / CBS 128990) TaxID=675120 RepID=M2YHS3_DOTSN|nr:glycoside hydrolase family 10 protein [Dothistroma septosporum NZE10]